MSFLRVELRDFHVRNCRGISEGQKLESGPLFSKSSCKLFFNFCINSSASSFVLLLAAVTVAVAATAAAAAAVSAATAAANVSVLRRLRDELSWTDIVIPCFLKVMYRVGMEKLKADCDHVLLYKNWCGYRKMRHHSYISRTDHINQEREIKGRCFRRGTPATTAIFTNQSHLLERYSLQLFQFENESNKDITRTRQLLYAHNLTRVVHLSCWYEDQNVYQSVFT